MDTTHLAPILHVVPTALDVSLLLWDVPQAGLVNQTVHTKGCDVPCGEGDAEGAGQVAVTLHLQPSIKHQPIKQ